jgi:hypothetical protein
VVTECGDAAGLVSPRRGGRARPARMARVPLGLSLGDVSTRSSDVNEPQINVDHFYHRPTYHVVGLLPEQSEIPALSQELASAGVDVSAVEILRGEQGVRILDAHGRYHGLRARIVRAFQQIGYDENTLAIYDEALGHGELVRRARPPVTASRRCCIATRFTMWATSGQACSSSSRPEHGLTWVRAGAQPLPGVAPGRVTRQHMVPVIPAVNRRDR